MRSSIVQGAVVGVLLVAGCVGFWLFKPQSPEVFAGKHTPSVQTTASIITQNQEHSVRAQVERFNRVAQEQSRRLQQSGWSEVQADPPDLSVVELDPALVPEREAELQLQLQTANLSDEAIDRVRLILQKTRQEKTRFLAIEALGRSQVPRAQSILVQSFDEVAEELQSHLLSQLRPQQVDDPGVEFLIQLLNKSVDESLKLQALGVLATMALVQSDAQNAVHSLQQRMSSESADRFQEILRQLKSGKRESV